MNKMRIIFLISLLNCVNSLLKSNEYFVDTCCSLDKNERIYLSCDVNEKLHLNLIEIFYNSDEYCSSELTCCKYRTKCSRRITKYFNLHCDEQNSCWIDKSCLKISKPCANIYGLYGQYITINYSCLSINTNSNNSSDDQPVSFIVQLLTSQDTTTTTNKYSLVKNQFTYLDDLKSSPIFLIGIILIFIFLMLIIYGLANTIGNKICRKHYSKTNEKTNLIQQKLIIKHENNEKHLVQSNSSLPVTRIYPCQSIYRYEQPYYNHRKYPYSYNHPYKQYINVEHNPQTGQISSRTFNTYWNYY